MARFKNGVLLVYNTLLLVLHLAVFLRVIYSGIIGEFDYAIFNKSLLIITGIQYLDILLSSLSFTSSHPVVVFTQVTGRLLVLHVASHVTEGKASVFSLIVVYLLSELCRGPYYLSLCLGTPSRSLAWLRYNAFKVLYPIGFTCEALVFANVYYYAYLEGAFVSSSGTDYSPYIAVSFLIFFGFIVRFLFGTMNKQAKSKSKLWKSE